MRTALGDAVMVGFACILLSTADAPARSQVDSPDAIRLPASMTLSDLIELVAQRTGTSVQYDKDATNKTVALRLNEPLPDSELWRVLGSVLQASNMAVIATDKPGLYRVLTLGEAISQARPQRLVVFDGMLIDDRASVFSFLIRPTVQDPASLARDLTPLYTTDTGSIKAVGDSGLLLIAGPTTKVKDILAIVASMESAPDPTTRSVVALVNTSATEMTRIFEQVQLLGGGTASGGAGATSSSIASMVTSRTARIVPLPDDQRVLLIAPASREQELRSLIQELDSRPPRTTRGYALAGIDPAQLASSIRLLLSSQKPGGLSAKAPLSSVEPDFLTGSVLVSATEAEHERIESFVAELRAAGAANRLVLRAFVIRNREATELRDTLAELLSLGGGGGEGVGDGVVSSTGTSGTPAIPLSRDISTPTSPLSGLSKASRDLEATTGDDFAPPPATSSSFLMTVDQATNSIIASGDPNTISQLEALIAELDQRQPQVMIEVNLVTLDNSESLSFGVELRKRFENGDTTTNLASLFGLAASDALGAGTGFTGTVLRPGDYEVVVRALETVSHGRTLSMPKVLVNNNATASVRSVRREPFTSINASNTVSTTSFGGTQDAGTTITVEPRIARGDHLVLKYSVELSAFTGAPTTTQDGGIIPPPSQQNSVEGDITLPDGHTVVVGGLDNLATGTSTSRVPWIGRIPILGALFGTTSDNDQNARFFVFIRATVLRDPAFRDLARLSTPDINSAGVDSGAPELTPRWVEE